MVNNIVSMDPQLSIVMEINLGILEVNISNQKKLSSKH